MEKLAIIFTVFSVAVSLSESCRDAIGSCDDGFVQKDVPGTEEELDSFCRGIIKFLECANDVIDKCEEEGEAEDPEFVQTLRSLLTNTRSVCDKDSSLNKALVENLPCIKTESTPAMMECRAMYHDEDVLKNFEKLLNEEGIEITGEEEDQENCVRALFFNGCFIASMGNKCGVSAMEVSMDIIEKFDFLSGACTDKIKGKLPEVVKSIVEEERKR